MKFISPLTSVITGFNCMIKDSAIPKKGNWRNVVDTSIRNGKKETRGDEKKSIIFPQNAQVLFVESAVYARVQFLQNAANSHRPRIYLHTKT